MQPRVCTGTHRHVEDRVLFDFVLFIAGSTLKANSLEVFDTLMQSTTRLFASKAAWENPTKRAKIEKLALLLRSVLNARKRLMVTFNCPKDKLEHMLTFIPAYVPHSQTRELVSMLAMTMACLQNEGPDRVCAAW